MNNFFSKKNINVFLWSFAAFFVSTVLANKYLSVFDVLSIRVSAALNPVLGMIFGWPAILACAAANFASDIISGWGIITAVLGFPVQIVYGLLPYIIWQRYIGCRSHITRLDNLKKVFVFLMIMLADSILMSLGASTIQFVTVHVDFISTALFVFLSDFNACVLIGFPMLSLFDLVYSRILHKGKRHLSFNEKAILLSEAAAILSFIFIIVTVNISGEGAMKEIWNKIFIYSTAVFVAIAVLTLIAMITVSIIKKNRAGLRIIEKRNGTIFVDEKKKIEFTSYPNQPMKYRTKADFMGFSLEDALKNVAPTYEEVWCATLSNQRGCPMKCQFCDCPGYGYHGNVSIEDLKYQIKTIISNTGTTYTKLFNVDFMRMGEPTLNPDILKFIEYDLVNEIRSKVDAEMIVPTISTMFPRNKKAVLEFLLEYCRIKNEVYDGNAGLQFSICTTDENVRNRIFKNRSLSLDEIAKIAKQLPVPKGEKYKLNFPVTKETVIDPEVIDRLFEKEKFAVKLTPVHDTFNAADNGFKITNEYDSYEAFAPIEKSFLDIGWDVIVSLEKKNEDDDLLTCGHSLISNISDKITKVSTAKKRVGIVVAIEINAVFEMYDNCKRLESPAGMKLYLVERDNYLIYIAQSGMGECAASAACQLLISKFNVSKIINFGVVGGLTEEMKQLKVCLVEKVVHYKYDCSEFMPLKVGQVDGYDSIFIKTNENLVKNALMINDDLSLVTCCSGDKFIGTKEEKMFLHENFEGDICDMESAGIVLTCDANKVPCILFKAVSDGLADGADGFYAELENASIKCLKIADNILDKIANIES